MLLLTTRAAHAQAGPDTLHGSRLSPPARVGHTMVVDSRRSRLLLIGGTEGIEPRDVYGQTILKGGRPEVLTRSLERDGQWVEMDLPTPAGAPVLASCAVYDSLRDRVLVIGGNQPTEPDTTRLADPALWALDLTGTPRWNPLVTEGPAPSGRIGAVAVLDRMRDRLILYGGEPVYAGPHTAELWVLPLDVLPLRWTQVPEDTTSGRWPGPTVFAGAAITPDGQRMVMYGGRTPFGYYNLTKTWELDLASLAWSRIPTDPAMTPPGRMGHPLVCDPSRGGLLLLPGNDAYSPDLVRRGSWVYDADSRSWRPLAASRPERLGEAGYAVARDPATGRIFIHGGSIFWPYEANGGNTALEVLPPAPAIDRELWFMRPGYGSPLGSVHPNCFMDERHDRMIMFWSDYLSTFDLRGQEGFRTFTLGGDTPPRDRMAAGFDPGRSRLWVVGARSTEDGPVLELYTLDLEGPLLWQHHTLPPGTPALAATPEVIFDRARDRYLVTFAGYRLHSRTWSFPAAPPYVATALDSTIDPYDMWPHATLLLDTHHDRLFRFGGRYPFGLGNHPHSNALYVRSVEPGGVWQQLDLPGAPEPRACAGFVLDPIHDRALVYGGMTEGLFFRDRDFSDFHELSLGAQPAWRRVPADGILPSVSRATALLRDEPRQRWVTFNLATVYALDDSPLKPLSTGIGELSLVPDETGVPRVRVVWPGPFPATAAVRLERSLDGGATWAFLDMLNPDGVYAVTYQDTLTSLADVGYRLLAPRGGPLAFLSQVLGPRQTAIPTSFAALRIQPLPARDELTLSFTAREPGPLVLTLFDIAGRRLAQERFTVSAGAQRITTRLTRQRHPGLYLLRAESGRERITRRVAIVR